jgi:hypothetical protein
MYRTKIAIGGFIAKLGTAGIRQSREGFIPNWEYEILEISLDCIEL